MNDLKKEKEVGNKSKSDLRKFWDFIWKDESIWGWLVSLVLIFLVIKFIFFPLLSFALGTNLPLVVIESSSMSHHAVLFGSFESWWSQESNSNWYTERGFTKEQANDWPLSSGLEKGDIALVISGKNVNIGDIIIFNAGQRHPIIHRAIQIDEDENGNKIYDTKGDNNQDQITFDKNISQKNVVGKAIFKIPKLGWIKLFFVQLFD